MVERAKPWHTKQFTGIARISARKVRPLADLIRGKSRDEALDILKYQPQRGARMLEKVLKARWATPKIAGLRMSASLVVVDARVDGGPMFKRIRPRARGMAFMIKKRMSHIRVTVDSADDRFQITAGISSKR